MRDWVKSHFTVDIRDSVTALSTAGNLGPQFLNFFQSFKKVYRNEVCTPRWYTLFVAMLKLARVFIDKKQTVFEHFRHGMFSFGKAIKPEFFKSNTNPFLNNQSIPNCVSESDNQLVTKQLLETLLFENPRCIDLAHNVLPDEDQPQVWNDCSEFNGHFFFREEKRNALAIFEVFVTNSSVASDQIYSNSLHIQLSQTPLERPLDQQSSEQSVLCASKELPSTCDTPSAGLSNSKLFGLNKMRFSAGAAAPGLPPVCSPAVKSPQVCTRQHGTSFCLTKISSASFVCDNSHNDAGVP